MSVEVQEAYDNFLFYRLYDSLAAMGIEAAYIKEWRNLHEASVSLGQAVRRIQRNVGGEARTVYCSLLLNKFNLNEASRSEN